MNRLLQTPSNRTSLWIMANVAWFASIPAHAAYLTRLQRSGELPVNADSIGIPLFGWGILAFALAIPLNAVWRFLSRRYPGSVPLVARAAAGEGRRAVSAALLALTGLVAVFVVQEALATAYEVAVVGIAWAYLALAFRAAYVQSPRGDVPIAA